MLSLDFTRVLNVLFFGFFLMKEMADACNMTAVNECTEILSRSTNGNLITDGISAIPSVEQLKKMCGSMEEFKTCYQPEAAKCKRDVAFSMTFGTIENTIEYLCVEGYKDILQYAACWNRTDVIKGSTQCHIAQNNMITTLHSQQMVGKLDSTAMRTFWCEILDNTTACMRGGVEPKCGTAPGCIMHTMMSRALKGLTALMKCAAPVPCQLHSDGTTQEQHSHHDSTVDPAGQGAHSDGTSHTHGDIHPDHEHDGQADAEVTDDNPDNAADSAVFTSFLMFISVPATYFFIYQTSFY